MSARVEKVVTSGTFSLDGGTWEVDNNVWLIGDDQEVIVVDAAHDADAIVGAIGDRRVVAILLTHAHDDHVDAAPALTAATGATAYLHPEDRVLWELAHPDLPMPSPLAEGQTFEVAGIPVVARHTPGHAPGACVFVVDDLGAVFTGDTLFQGGPGATGRSYSDFDTIVDSISSVLLPLPVDTVVHTGHGDDTTIGAEAPHRQEWIDRGHCHQGSAHSIRCVVEQAVPWRVWTVPNALSAVRLIGVPVFLWLLLTHHDLWAFAVLFVSGFTDWADGKIARRYNLVSRVGQLLDPLADRLYIISMVIGLAIRSIIPWWLVVVLLLREVFVFSFGPALRANRLPIPSVHFTGKAATLCLICGFPLILLGATDLPVATAANWVGWGFAWWGTGLYWFAGLLYAVQIRGMIATVRA